MRSINDIVETFTTIHTDYTFCIGEVKFTSKSDAIRQLKRAGMRNSDIARAVGVSQQRVGNTLKRSA